MASTRDRRFSTVTGLGEFRRLYRTVNTFRVVSIGLAGLLLAPLAYRLISHQPFAEGGVADLLLSLVGAPLVFWLTWRRSGDTVALYNGGIACDGRAGLVQIKWDEIRTLWKTPGDIEKDRPVQYSLETLDGGRVDLAGLADIEQLWTVIQENVARPLLPDLVKQIQAGLVLPFGAFQLGATGLEIRKKDGKQQFAEWARIQVVEEESGGFLPQWNVRVRVEDNPASHTYQWIRVPRFGIPDLHVFLALCRHFIGSDPAV